MFTGIITDRGRIRAILPGGDTGYEIGTDFDAGDLPLGASIGCSGVCLTVIAATRDWFRVQASAETKARSTVGLWRVGTAINLERPLRLGDELGGHLVSGHVDGIGRVVARSPEGDSMRLVFAAPAALAPAIAPKGSIAVDGVSLTVNEVAGEHFGVNIIPHTRSVTSLGALDVGDCVNLEIDLIARYVARLMGKEVP